MRVGLAVAFNLGVLVGSCTTLTVPQRTSPVLTVTPSGVSAVTSVEMVIVPLPETSPCQRNVFPLFWMSVRRIFGAVLRSNWALPVDCTFSRDAVTPVKSNLEPLNARNSTVI